MLRVLCSAVLVASLVSGLPLSDNTLTVDTLDTSLENIINVDEKPDKLVEDITDGLMGYYRSSLITLFPGGAGSKLGATRQPVRCGLLLPRQEEAGDWPQVTCLVHCCNVGHGLSLIGNVTFIEKLN